MAAVKFLLVLLLVLSPTIAYPSLESGSDESETVKVVFHVKRSTEEKPRRYCGARLIKLLQEVCIDAIDVDGSEERRLNRTRRSLNAMCCVKKCKSQQIRKLCNRVLCRVPGNTLFRLYIYTTKKRKKRRS
ncbi:hypothetical protein QR680_008360 [Steinernema hermaphroditum]|uniref:Insulin-like domain-containing protein n=1 Tax=Steinernema hermaphroditum TaxID=289476 RepID=A0AA39IHP6_9BILA|nr:hypothetical protein QR680_008360 [Steinernema hermaphroditum]